MKHYESKARRAARRAFERAAKAEKKLEKLRQSTAAYHKIDAKNKVMFISNIGELGTLDFIFD